MLFWVFSSPWVFNYLVSLFTLRVIEFQLLVILSVSVIHILFKTSLLLTCFFHGILNVYYSKTTLSQVAASFFVRELSSIHCHIHYFICSNIFLYINTLLFFPGWHYHVTYFVDFYCIKRRVFFSQRVDLIPEPCDLPGYIINDIILRCHWRNGYLSRCHWRNDSLLTVWRQTV